MIDDFVRPPNSGTGKRPGKKPNQTEDFLPDLSQDSSVAPEPESTFVTPEEAASQDEFDETIDLGEPDVNAERPNSSKSPKQPSKPHWWTRFNNWFKGLSKKKKALFIIAVLLVLVGIEAGIYALISGKNPVEQVAIIQPKKKPSTTVASNLTGLQVAPELNDKPVTGVMVENSVDARPQAGLYNAGVVFEAIAEGGITRFLALYQDTAPESIGPVRSARPYFIDWALGFDATYAHVGGSPEALQKIRNENVKDMDQSYNSKYFQRVTSRYAPHNVFTSSAQLAQLEQSKGYGKSNFTSFPRKKERPSKQPTAKTIALTISSARFNVLYTYDPTSNSYLRTLGGQPHTDEKTNKQITPKVVVAMVMNYSIASDGKHSVYNTIGNGHVYIFQDGTVAEGTWEKTDKTKQITFTDAAGKPIKLNPGQTWLTAVNSANSVTYQP